MCGRETMYDAAVVKIKYVINRYLKKRRKKILI